MYAYTRNGFCEVLVSELFVFNKQRRQNGDKIMDTGSLLRYGIINTEKWDKVNEIVMMFSKWIYDESEKWFWNNKRGNLS